MITMSYLSFYAHYFLRALYYSNIMDQNRNWKLDEIYIHLKQSWVYIAPDVAVFKQQ